MRASVGSRTVCGVMRVVDVTLNDVCYWSETSAISITGSLQPFYLGPLYTLQTCQAGLIVCACGLTVGLRTSSSRQGSSGQPSGTHRLPLAVCSYRILCLAHVLSVTLMLSKFCCLSFPLVVHPICTTALESYSQSCILIARAGLPERCLRFDSWHSFETRLPLLLW